MGRWETGKSSIGDTEALWVANAADVLLVYTYGHCKALWSFFSWVLRRYIVLSCLNVESHSVYQHCSQIFEINEARCVLGLEAPHSFNFHPKSEVLPWETSSIL